MSDSEASAQSVRSLDIKGILAALPHRYPMLLVDRVEALVPDESIHAVKAVSFNEDFFQRQADWAFAVRVSAKRHEVDVPDWVLEFGRRS